MGISALRNWLYSNAEFVYKMSLHIITLFNCFIWIALFPSLSPFGHTIVIFDRDKRGSYPHKSFCAGEREIPHNEWQTLYCPSELFVVQWSMPVITKGRQQGWGTYDLKYDEHGVQISHTWIRSRTQSYSKTHIRKPDLRFSEVWITNLRHRFATDKARELRGAFASSVVHTFHLQFTPFFL
jgi:hypothetical protein